MTPISINKNHIEQTEKDTDLEHDVHALPHHQPVHQVYQVQVGQLPVQAQHLVVEVIVVIVVIVRVIMVIVVMMPPPP